MNRVDLAREIIQVAFERKEGHIASALSVLDFVTEYFSKDRPDDSFIMSKGHASLALYAGLYLSGKLSIEEFRTFCEPSSSLGGHPSSRKIPSVTLSTGSLGHGLPFACGLAMARKNKGQKGRVFCLIGDGEANEGTTWESALFANTYNLDNLTCFMDFNQSGERAIKMAGADDRFSSFGWSSLSIDGHSRFEIASAIQWKTGKPIFVHMNTIKGKGCPVMEGNPEWHHKSPSSQEELETLIKSLY
jgi:transketolase